MAPEATVLPRYARAVLLVLSLLALIGCKHQPYVELGGERFTVELARTDAELARGLMFRDELAKGHGMLFLWDHEAPRAFWMKNTRIPLDILYFDAERKLVSVAANTPPCSLGDRCPSYPSEGPAQYVLELNAGEARRLKLERGAEIRFFLER